MWLLLQVLLCPDGFSLRYLWANVLERLHSLSLGTNIRQESESSESPKRASNFSMGLKLIFSAPEQLYALLGKYNHNNFLCTGSLLLLFLFCFEFPSSSVSEILHGIMM